LLEVLPVPGPRTASITGFIGSGAAAISAWSWTIISSALPPWILPFWAIFMQIALAASAQA
jgi:hypothetical protein